MNTTRLLMAVALLAASAPAAAVTWGRPGAMHGFGGWRDELQSIANRFGTGSMAHFCIVVRSMRLNGRSDRTAFVYWKERQTIQGYGESADNRMTSDLAAGAQYIDLKHGLVDSEEQINGSIVLETRAHANAIIDNCRRHGTTLAIRRESQREPH